ncbi:hypothetical protein EXM22_09710 [Oceanispirochaeta crateris]|uniref:Uncharacterized protein n=1 Tax=Oceanispirochaeta crateris TaxID=2518645 RepID=A0A5C1QM12_9SPIO|nr:hypothetical protein [Oceanispirochaeta crateris]QEN08249.1 hypothetical protein EXM22_09710 [Oceanispirochaeta crateris]
MVVGSHFLYDRNFKLIERYQVLESDGITKEMKPVDEELKPAFEIFDSAQSRTHHSIIGSFMLKAVT